jgi:hypothetical protein
LEKERAMPHEKVLLFVIMHFLMDGMDNPAPILA